ncbi:MAG: polysaccharide biosynthesis protein [Candidatus Limnocylindrales bacterium]
MTQPARTQPPASAFVPRGRHLFVYDVVVTAMAIVISFGLRFDATNVIREIQPYLPVALLPLIVMPPVYVAFGLYRREWRYASVQEMFTLAEAVAVASAIGFVVFLALSAAKAPGAVGFPRSVFAIEALVGLALVGGGRFAVRASLERRGVSGGTDAEGGVRTIIYGAGEAGVQVARLAQRDPGAGIIVAGFLDDDRTKKGVKLLGRPIFGDLDELGRAVRKTDANQLLVAMPSAPGAVIRRAFDRGRELGLEVRTVPFLRELLTGEVRLDRIRRVSLEDLLRREPVAIDSDAIAAYLNGASVLVTGGGGSIGSELVRQILALGPRRLTVLDHHEEALWSIERELGELATRASGVDFAPVLADVRSLPAVESVIRACRPDVVFHTAALKHVPIVEQHPAEGVMTNVVGTRNTLLACEHQDVARFVLISTDKAVEPISAMGATKRLAELLTIAAARRTGRAYVAVRFGNVLGSSGSVIPTFQRQLAEGHALTITHPDATRYFMTIPEAVSLILETGTSAESGDVYVLDMGEPVRIVDLARDLIRLSGMDPDRVPMVQTGLRAGERLHETLFYDHETTDRTIHEGIFRARADGEGIPAETVERLADQLEKAAAARDDDAVRALLQQVRRLGGTRAPGTAVGTGPAATPATDGAIPIEADPFGGAPGRTTE